jgi:DnaK suppressor protein
MSDQITTSTIAHLLLFARRPYDSSRLSSETRLVPAGNEEYEKTDRPTPRQISEGELCGSTNNTVPADALPCRAEREASMDQDRAHKLLRAERARLQGLLSDTGEAQQLDRAAERETGSGADGAQPLAAEGLDDAFAAGQRERLVALDRAEARLDEGTYGRSIRSGLPIPDERLEADPAAELTVEEAEAQP